MLGKICGIGLVAVTQIVIWAVLIVAMSAFVMPALLPADVAADITSINSGMGAPTQSALDSDFLAALAVIADPTYVLTLFGILLLFLIGGFLLYSAVFAAIGSAVDNIQDASQLRDCSHAPHHSRHCVWHDGRRRSHLVDSCVDLYHTLHVAHGDDGAYPLRHPVVADHPVAGPPLCRAFWQACGWQPRYIVWASSCMARSPR